jgi:hypothetical protein
MASTTYLTNIYSLLVSALISMSQGQLTRNDAIFVLVATVSPATLYLWIIVCFAALNKGFLPDYLNREIMNKVGQRLLILLSFVSFVLWVVVAVLALRPQNSNYFSQPACDKVYGKKQLSSLLWSVMFLVSCFVAVAVVSVIAWYLRKHMAGRGAPSDL